ncbi:acid trehalase [Dendryphion nanum]|uniref:alpha,alpha-trehalase n=1 Tax=Dendryphion nanum TaxID=256645 RepID=A0A9P9EGU4_9PLEO|nr:acid trehalase [Dendryphion nanum]
MLGTSYVFACLLTFFAHRTRANRDVQTRFEGVRWDDDNWRIINRKLETGYYQSRMSLSNGYLGINVAALGPFFEADTPQNGDNINGWPLFDRRQTFASISGFWNYQETIYGTNYPWLSQYGGESVLSGVPHWGSLILKTEAGNVLNASTDTEHIQGYRSTLDVEAAKLSWDYDWKPGGEEEVVNVAYDMFVHKLYINQAIIKLTLIPSRDTNITIYDVLEGSSATNSDFVEKKYEEDSPTIYTAVSPTGVHNVTAYIYSTLRGGENVNVMQVREYSPEGPFNGNSSSIAQSFRLEMEAGQEYVIQKFVGGASSDAFLDPKRTASDASHAAATAGYSKSLRTHIKEWNTIMPKYSVDRYLLANGSIPDDENIRELQIVSVTNPFQILQNTIGPNAIIAAHNNTRLGIDSVPVCGWGSSCYAGLIFWDAEVWISPGLQVSHPFSMKQVIEYRLDKFLMANDNIKTAYSSSQNESGKFSDSSAVYPWTSGRYGNCTGTGPCFDYEYHLNGDIGIAMYNHYAVTGDADYYQDSLLPVHNSIAQFFAELVTYNETSGSYGLFNATDPDEYANNVNNAGFTLALIQKQLRDTNMLNSWFGIEENKNWTNIANRITVPYDKKAGIILEYKNMPGDISVKQADIVLIDDLLHTHSKYSLANLDYYAAKQSLNGPGMTYGVFSIVSNEISPSGCSAYTYDLWSSQPYVRAPWFQYSEQLLDDFEANGGTHPAYPFLTGMGGSNRIAIFGYLGLRLFVDRLDIDPSLPPQIPRLDYRTFYWMGHGINATSNQTHTTLARLPVENFTLPKANTTYLHKPIPVTLGNRRGKFYLDYDSPITVRNRRIGEKPTVAGNILQCQSNVYSEAPYLPGQIPSGAVDGAASTRWQPAFANMTSWITIDTLSTKFDQVTEITFDWADQPPDHYEVIFSNTSHYPPFSNSELPDLVNVTASNTIAISRPWDQTRAHIVQKYKGNQTNITFSEPVWTAQFIHLGISGNQAFSRENSEGATVAEFNVITKKRRVWEEALEGQDGDDDFGREKFSVQDEYAMAVWCIYRSL